VKAGECEDSCNGIQVIGGVARGLYALGTLDSILTAPAAVRRHNERIKNLSIVPVIQPGRTGPTGVMLGGRF
jgi:hypothetical protein